jgi:hypothetical protein
MAAGCHATGRASMKDSVKILRNPVSQDLSFNNENSIFLVMAVFSALRISTGRWNQAE